MGSKKNKDLQVLVKGALIGGFVAFMWTNISWMVLPWHWMTISNLPQEAAMEKALKANVQEHGLYIVPWTTEKTEKAQTEVHRKMERGPFAFMVVRPQGVKSGMGKMMLLGLLANIMVALMLTFLLTKTKGLSYVQKIGFVKIAALAGALVILMPTVIWWQFPLGYTLVTLIDTGLTWGFAGLAIGKIVKA